MNKENIPAKVSIDSFVFEHDLTKLKDEHFETAELITSDLSEPEVILPDLPPSSPLDPRKIVDQDEG